MGAPEAHIPVLADAALAWLRVVPGGTYVDATTGLGGHSRLVAARLSGGGRLVGLDRDPSAVAAARALFSDNPAVTIVHRNYSELRTALDELNIDFIDGLLLDAGFSSVQLDDPERGLSFQTEGPLDMRLDTTQPLTAERYLTETAEGELARVLRAYGDVGPARRIAASIVRRRREGRLHTTGDLAGAVAEALPFVGGMPEETRTVFQSIRIAVNDELRHLEQGLEQAVEALRPGGRLVVIGFHSGEDRIIKNVLRRHSRAERLLHPDGRVRETRPARLQLLTPKPVVPDPEECRRNPRAHSAKLRAAERLAERLRVDEENA